jgi:hypothetical protein
MEELAGTDAGKKMKEDKQWNSALAKAKGEKVKDDLKKLKQTAKRRTHQKKKSATDWKDRNDAVKQSQAERQEERRRNIADRIRKIKDKKIGKKVLAHQSKHCCSSFSTNLLSFFLFLFF